MTQPYQIKPTVQADYSIRFKDGKLEFFQSGESIFLNSPIAVQSGVIILTDGTILFSDGSVKKLKEGDSYEIS